MLREFYFIFKPLLNSKIVDFPSRIAANIFSVSIPLANESLDCLSRSFDLPVGIKLRSRVTELTGTVHAICVDFLRSRHNSLFIISMSSVLCFKQLVRNTFHLTVWTSWDRLGGAIGPPLHSPAVEPLAVPQGFTRGFNRLPLAQFYRSYRGFLFVFYTLISLKRDT